MTAPVREFEEIIGRAKAVFCSKGLDYGPTFLLLRWPSLLDQIWIKLCRLRTLEELCDKARVTDRPEDEYLGIINYGVMGCMKAGGALPGDAQVMEEPSLLDGISQETLSCLYDEAAQAARALMEAKNHDYGGAWRSMELRAITDLMLIKVQRCRHIAAGTRQMAEADDLTAQLLDIINYCVFSLIKLGKL